MNNPQYQIVQPTQILCSFCGAGVHPRINETHNPQTNEVTRECKWTCGRCGNLVKIGRLQ